MQSSSKQLQLVYNFKEDNLTVKIGHAVNRKPLPESTELPWFPSHNIFPLFPTFQHPFMNYFRMNEAGLNTCKSLNGDETIIKIEEDSFIKKNQQKTKDPKLLGALDISNIDLLCQIAQSVQYEEQKIRDIHSRFQNSPNQFETSLFQIYVSKLKGMKKTKQEKLKFLIRRSLKYVSAKKSLKDKIRPSQTGNKQGIKKQQLGFNLDNIGKRLTSKFSEKTLVAALKESDEYRQIFIESLESAEQQFAQNNRKKVNQVAKIIQKCLQDRSVNYLKARLKMPWTKCIFDNIIQYGHELLLLSQ